MSAIAGTIRGGVRALSATSRPGLLRGIEAIASWPVHRIPAMLGLRNHFQVEQFLEKIDSVEYGGK